MANLFKWFDRLLTFITNNKLVSLFLPLILAGGVYSTYEGFSLKDRVAALESKPGKTVIQKVEVPGKPVIQEAPDRTYEKDLESIKSRMDHYHPE